MRTAEKLRKVANWADWQTESTNEKFKSADDMIKAFDYCRESDLVEFLDGDSLMKLEDDEREQVEKEVTELLGYNIF